MSASLALTPPVYTPVDNPIGVDKVVLTINRQLANVPDIAYVLGRIVPQHVDGKLQPWLSRHVDNNEYYLAYPNDMLNPMSFSCIYFHENERWINDFYCSRSVSVIVWANLKQIDTTLEELKRKVRVTLSRLMVLDSGTYKFFDQTTSGASGIYPIFDVSSIEERFLTEPYGAFRLEAVCTYLDSCLIL